MLCILLVVLGTHYFTNYIDIFLVSFTTLPPTHHHLIMGTSTSICASTTTTNNNNDDIYRASPHDPRPFWSQEVLEAVWMCAHVHLWLCWDILYVSL